MFACYQQRARPQVARSDRASHSPVHTKAPRMSSYLVEVPQVLPNRCIQGPELLTDLWMLSCVSCEAARRADPADGAEPSFSRYGPLPAAAGVTPSRARPEALLLPRAQGSRP